jgi:hypothetical protein
VNIRFMFNGDRLAFIEAYRVKVRQCRANLSCFRLNRQRYHPHLIGSRGVKLAGTPVIIDARAYRV